MCEDEPEVVVLATKILARLVVVIGSGYSKKFAEKSGGYIILEHRLKKWWDVPALWPICLSIFFGVDHALLDLNKALGPSELLKAFLIEGDVKVVFPDMLPVIMNMLKSGVRNLAMASDAQEGTPASLEERASKCETPKMNSLKLPGRLSPLMTMVWYFRLTPFSTVRCYSLRPEYPWVCSYQFGCSIFRRSTRQVTKLPRFHCTIYLRAGATFCGLSRCCRC